MIPFVDISADHREIRDALDDAVDRVIDSGQFVLGEEVASFEVEFASYCGVEHCVGVASGTDALVLALRACGIGPGDEVVVPAFGFAATAFAVLAIGAEPVFVDVEEDTALLDVDRVAAALGERTRAVIPVHLYGRCMELDELVDLCTLHDLFVIEDAAQAHGARLHGHAAGAVGHVGCFSFYPSKNLGAAGEAGAVITRDPELADRVLLLRNHGQRLTYRHTSFGANSRLDEIQAAILRAKLPHLDRWNGARRHAVELYTSLLGHIVRAPPPGEAGEHVFHVYAIRLEARNRVRRLLATKGIATRVHYPVPLHRQPALREARRGAPGLPVSERLAEEVLSLPMFATISEEQIHEVAEQLVAAVAISGSR